MVALLSYEFVRTAILCALILAGIHAYLGFHIVSRGVIFVDLSLAQAAALGTIIAATIGAEAGKSYIFSLLFTLIGAGIVSIARTRDERVPQEAFIGILYVGCAALTILILAHRPGGMEELQHMLAGSLLTVSPGEIGKLVLIYAAIGMLHYIFKNQFFTLTTNREAAEREGWKMGWWDFLFYASFGIVVTSAVPIAGVLLVFSFLVIPPVIALLITRRSSHRLAIGWVIALLGSVGGIFSSARFNLPAGPSIIAFLVVMLIVTSLARSFRKSRSES